MMLRCHRSACSFRCGASGIANRSKALAHSCRHQRGRFHVAAASISSNDFRPGTMVEIDGAPYRVTEFLHVKPGKGAAFVRTKLKNYITGNSVDKTFRAGESVESASVDKRESQFTYVEGDQYVFMDLTSYEETRIPKDDSWAKYLMEGMEVQLLTWNGKVISVDVPNTVEIEVIQTDPGVKGNTASGGSKPATLASGAVIQVPLFIESGQRITVDTRTDTYLGKVSK
ncbi:hypothetical protein WJX72_002289 [[Myrmecia] bisecta]|uniref:Elongation factor P n=1 Tax=[Myrmecia] bisecta TaxID=41462 RepID=A0AAW1PDB6_9CHLO